MEKKIKIKMANEEVEGIEIDFEAAKEPWLTYKLADGSIIKLKLIVSKIVRVDNKYDSEGNPWYVIKTGNVIEITSPEELKKK